MRLVAIALALVLLPLPLRSQQPSTIRRAIEGVRIDALVSDRGKPLTGLNADDFEVLDDGTPQKVEHADVARSVSVAVLLDLSFSVLDGGHVRQLVTAVRSYFEALTTADSAALLTFSRGVYLVQPLTHDVRLLRQSLDGSVAAAPRRIGDATAMWDAIVAAGSLVAEQPGRPIVLLLSDTQDNASWLFPAQPEDARWTIQQRDRIIDLLKGAGIVVDVVWIPRSLHAFSGHDDSYGPLKPSRPADLTGGVAFAAADRDLPQRLGNRLTELRSGYVLTFTPTGVPHDGRWHKLTVRLRHRRGKISARPGYFSIGQ